MPPANSSLQVPQAFGESQSTSGFSAFSAPSAPPQQQQQLQHQQQPPAQQSSSFQFGGAPSTGFSFGAGNNAPAASAPTSFSFGATQNTQQSAPAPFSFGSSQQPSSQQGTPAPTFAGLQSTPQLGGQGTPQLGGMSQPQPQTSGFSFGGASTSTPAMNSFSSMTANGSQGAGNLGQPQTSGFSFSSQTSGPSSTPATNLGSTFNPFKSTMSSTPAPVSTAAATPSLFANSGFSAPSSQPAVSAAPTTSGFSFSSMTPSAPAAASSTSLFSVPKPAEAAQDKPSLFSGFSSSNGTNLNSTSTTNGFGNSLFSKPNAAVSSSVTAPAATTTAPLTSAFSTPAIPSTTSSNITSTLFSFSNPKLGTQTQSTNDDSTAATPAAASASFGFLSAKPKEEQNAPATNSLFSNSTGLGLSGGFSSGMANGATPPTSLFSRPAQSSTENKPDSTPSFSGFVPPSGTSLFTAKPTETSKPTASLFSVPAPAPAPATSSEADPKVSEAPKVLDSGAMFAFKNHPTNNAIFNVAKLNPTVRDPPAVGPSKIGSMGSNLFSVPSGDSAPSTSGDTRPSALGLGSFAPKTFTSAAATADTPTSVATTDSFASTSKSSARSDLGPTPNLSFRVLNQSLLDHIKNEDDNTDWSPIFLHYLRTVLESGLGNLSERKFPPKTAFSVVTQAMSASSKSDTADPSENYSVGQKRRNDESDQPPTKRPSSLFLDSTKATFSTPFAAKSQDELTPEEPASPVDPLAKASKSSSQTARLFDSIIGGPSKPAEVQIADAPAKKAASESQPSPFSVTWAGGKPPSQSIFPSAANSAASNAAEPKSATHPAFSAAGLKKPESQSESVPKDTAKPVSTTSEPAKNIFSFTNSTSSNSAPGPSLFSTSTSAAPKPSSSSSPFAGFGAGGKSSFEKKDGAAFSSTGTSLFSSNPSKPPTFSAGLQPSLGGGKSLFFSVGQSGDGSASKTSGSSAPPFSFTKTPDQTASATATTTSGDAAAANDEESQNDPQLDLASMDAEKETHEAPFEVGYARLQFRNAESKSLEVQGTGRLALLRKKGEPQAKTRVLLKATPSGRLLVNGWMIGTFSRVGNKSAQGSVMIHADSGMKSKVMVFNFQSGEVADKFVEATKSCTST